MTYDELLRRLSDDVGAEVAEAHLEFCSAGTVPEACAECGTALADPHLRLILAPHTPERGGYRKRICVGRSSCHKRAVKTEEQRSCLEAERREKVVAAVSFDSEE